MDWKANWDEEIGLWSQASPGHTIHVAHLPRVHPGPNAAAMLCLAAEMGCLADLPAETVLKALRRMQVTDRSEMHGCLLWYAEEPGPADTNAAFFTAISLLVIHRFYAEQLSPAAKECLSIILRDLRIWFHHAVGRRTWNYLNKYLGDLACAWLLQDAAGAEPEASLVDAMHEAAAYWRANGYGWGEHMSDVYADVALSEVSLLLLAGSLPDDLRQAYSDLQADLLAIEDAFEGGPRVPVLRGYWFEHSPTRVSYRDQVRPRPPGEPKVGNMPDLGNLFHHLGWHGRVPARQGSRSDVTVPCFGGTAAVTKIEPDVRLGSMTRFPVMPSADHFTWGLSWQSFPVALWRNEGDWAFLQWHTQEGGKARCHPAGNYHGTYLRNALTETVSPPLTGRTTCIQKGGRLLALRIMPGIAMGWQSAGDRLRLIDGHAEISEPPPCDRFAQLLLRYPQRQVSVGYLDLARAGLPQTRRDGARLDWQVMLEGDALSQRRMLVGLWSFCLDGALPAVPDIRLAKLPTVPRTAEEQAWDVVWHWPDGRWRVRVDPLSPTPLTDDGDCPTSDAGS